MNKYDERYIIRIADLSDKDRIMSFIGRYWKSGHILAVDKAFFDYEFKNENGYNFVVAYEKEKNLLAGIIGFNRASDDKDCLDIWGVMWKVADELKPIPFLGIELMKRLILYTGCRTELGVGANIHTSIPLLKLMLHFYTGKMDHYYRLSNKESYSIAIINHVPDEIKTTKKVKGVFIPFCDINEIQKSFDFAVNKGKYVPYKNAWYIEHRFLHHPYYKYNIWGIKVGEDVSALMVSREVMCNNVKILRIVDYYGEQSAFGTTYDVFTELLSEYEYIDFYCSGMDHSSLEDAGFCRIEDDDSNIIPDYFSPFEQKNIDIWVNANYEGCTFFKADGDQDRPN